MHKPTPAAQAQRIDAEASIIFDDIEGSVLHDPPTEDSDRPSMSSLATISARRTQPWRVTAGITALLAIIAVAAIALSNDMLSSNERGHANWQHVAAADKSSRDWQAETLRHVDRKKQPSTVTSIELSSRDLDRHNTSKIRRAVAAGDMHKANGELQAAQRIPMPTLVPPISPQPSLPPQAEILTAIKDGRSQFYRLQLFDSCDEDGDLVQVSFNGHPYATVPLTHAGATIAFPLQSGTTAIGIKGIRDGHGGITVRFASSQGDYFARKMLVGEEYVLGVVVP